MSHLPTSSSPVLWIYIIQYVGTPNFYIPRFIYAVPINQISTTNTIQQYTFPRFQLNVSVAEYIGVGFGKTTGGSPCRVLAGDSSYTNANGGANQTLIAGSGTSWSYNSQSCGVPISYTVLTTV